MSAAKRVIPGFGPTLGLTVFCLSAVVLLGYAVSVHRRYRAERDRQRRSGTRGEHA